jgi:hypothetical protein
MNAVFNPNPSRRVISHNIYIYIYTRPLLQIKYSSELTRIKGTDRGTLNPWHTIPRRFQSGCPLGAVPQFAILQKVADDTAELRLEGAQVDWLGQLHKYVNRVKGPPSSFRNVYLRPEEGNRNVLKAEVNPDASAWFQKGHCPVLTRLTFFTDTTFRVAQYLTQVTTSRM